MQEKTGHEVAAPVHARHITMFVLSCSPNAICLHWITNVVNLSPIFLHKWGKLINISFLQIYLNCALSWCNISMATWLIVAFCAEIESAILKCDNMAASTNQHPIREEVAAGGVCVRCEFTWSDWLKLARDRRMVHPIACQVWLAEHLPFYKHFPMRPPQMALCDKTSGTSGHSIAVVWWPWRPLQYYSPKILWATHMVRSESIQTPNTRVTSFNVSHSSIHNENYIMKVKFRG